jgi:hypothetical protein
VHWVVFVAAAAAAAAAAAVGEAIMCRWTR